MDPSLFPPLPNSSNLPSSSKTLNPLPWDRILPGSPTPCEFSIAPFPTPDEIIDFPSADIAGAVDEWNLALVGYSLGKRPFYEALLSAVQKLWSLKGNLKLISLSEGFFLFKFSCSEDFEMVWSKGAWFIFGISKIATKIGYPLAVDALTATKSRLTYARVCVQVDASAAYPETVPICVDGKIFNLMIQYEWRPSLCSCCNSINHQEDQCPSNPNRVTQAAKPPPKAFRGRSTSRKPRPHSTNAKGILPTPTESQCPDFWDSLISVFAIPTSGNPIISLYDKLHHLKDIIKGKSWNSFDSIKRKCDDLSLQQQKIQLSSNQDLLSTAICEELKKVNTELVFYNSLRYSSSWKVGQRNVTSFWKSICSTASQVKLKFQFQISQNSPIAVFWDHWCSNNTLSASFPELINYNCNTNSVLGDWMHLTDWDLPPNLSNQVTEFISAIPISSNGNKHILWNNLDKVTFKDFYLDYYANDTSVEWHKMVWHKKFALRYSAYSWLAISGGLKTVDALLKRNVNIVDRRCSLCHDSFETTNHIFFECLFSFNVLTRLMPTFHNFLLHPNIHQAFDHIYGIEENLKVINGTLLLLNATVYFIWLERNNRRFNSKYLCDISLAKQISRAVYLKLDRWKAGKEIKLKLNLKF
ncbi:hypothetical protein M5K25_015509 [Dendrobium thyrsiflorum]|uniref:Reverse transcriptase zinc-binding domain-containing protein n=1 Tax=Dendrobium thyrsiflorum TaxID=117978 RepID=A0ABD0URA9_DENTH